MQNAGYSGRGGFTNHRPRVIFRISRVDHDWSLLIAGQLYLRRKSDELCGAGRVIVVVIEAAFADGHGASFQMLPQFPDVPLGIESVGIVGMNPGREEDEAGIFGRAASGHRGRAERLTDADDRARAGPARASDYRVAVA